MPRRRRCTCRAPRPHIAFLHDMTTGGSSSISGGHHRGAYSSS